MRHFLSYWKHTQAALQLDAGGPFNHSASEQLSRVAPGDILWVATSIPPGRLVLIGRIVVGRVVDRPTAIEILGTNDIHHAKRHVIAEPGTAEPARTIEITDIADRLRFESTNDRLDVRDGRVNAGQLQAMRRLTASSGDLLDDLWTEHAEDGAAAVAEAGETSPASGFGNAATNRAVEAAAVAAVRSALQGEGWAVTSVEADRVGYDLRCERGDEEIHVEVKGTQSSAPTFIITEGELACAENDAAFELHVVTRTLEPARAIHRLTADELLDGYELTAIAYRARPRREEVAG